MMNPVSIDCPLLVPKKSDLFLSSSETFDNLTKHGSSASSHFTGIYCSNHPLFELSMFILVFIYAEVVVSICLMRNKSMYCC